MDIVVVDSGLGNLRSVERALLEAGGRATARAVSVQRSKDPSRIRRADCLVVPGQGGFRDCSLALQGELGQALLERIHAGTPYLGICLGLQILFESSEEAAGAPGLGLFAGTVQRLPGNLGLKVPHMGWNVLEVSASDHPILDASQSRGAWFYFVHSYHAVAGDDALVKGVASYGPLGITALVARDNVVATQFHPEKSQEAGLRFLAAFIGFASS